MTTSKGCLNFTYINSLEQSAVWQLRTVTQDTWISRALYFKSSSTVLQIRILISHTTAGFEAPSIWSLSMQTFPVPQWFEQGSENQMKYNKSPKHIKCLYAIQKSQIKWDRLKEDILFSLKEQLIYYWPHSWISQDFSPLGRQVIWFTSNVLEFICSTTSPLKHYVFNNVIML